MKTSQIFNGSRSGWTQSEQICPKTGHNDILWPTIKL